MRCLALMAVVPFLASLSVASAVEFGEADAGDPFSISGPTPNDLRLGLGLLPLATTITTRTNAATGYAKDGFFASAQRLALQWMLPVAELSQDGGGIFGVELSSNTYHQPQSTSDPEITYKAFAVTLHPGFAWLLTRRTLHLEVGPFLGYGMSSVSSGSGRGDYWEYGMRLGLYYTIARHFQIGVDGCYMGTYGRQDFTYGAAREDIVIKTQGFSGGIHAGYRF